MDTPYDTIILGAGSAGCVLAARLSEDAERRVLLLEAGPYFAPDGYPPDMTADFPATEPERVWGYLSDPGRAGHALPAHSGKVLGGGSAINAGIARHGRPNDFARWVGHGLPEWSFERVLPAYKAMEQSDIDDPEYHGHAGPWPTRQSRAEDLTPPVRAYLEAAGSTGLAWVDDLNGPHVHGVGGEVKNIVDGVRTNAASAYLTAEVRARPNLEIRCDTLVDRVLVEGSRATGVLLANGDAIAADEVIVSAGVFGSPATLLRSGIGPAVHLRGLGIDVLADLPVGERFQDQPMYSIAYRLKDDAPDDPPGGSGTVWTRSTLAGEDELDVQLSVSTPPDLDERGAPVRTLRTWACVLTPRGAGTVRLKHPSPHVTPRIDYRMLAHPDDRQRLREAVLMTKRFMALAPVADMVDPAPLTEPAANPGAGTDANERLDAALQAGAMTFYHGTSTVPMGGPDDPAAVVDAAGRVRGIQGLRVVDASIFPEAISVAINMTVMMIAERIAGHIRTGAFRG